MTAICGLFYGYSIMATDVDVQFFSHLNGLTLSNNWGDMIRLLDTCLVNGLPLPSVTSASIDAQGDITLNLYADHKSLLFQIVELSGFEPAEINGKYRIKGTPTATKLILKATHVGKTVTKIGTTKLASLSYDIAFRDSADVKRAYRSKNPRTEHPFIRVDETISDGTNSYTSTYAKSAMVGLIENMTHIDDYQNPDVLQLPVDIANISKNWNITGVGSSVVRGWSRWHWASGSDYESNAPSNSTRTFTLCGNSNAFYFAINPHTENTDTRYKYIMGCGLYNSCLPSNVIPNWFLLSYFNTNAANVSVTNINRSNQQFSNPLTFSGNASKFYTCSYNIVSRMQSSVQTSAITPDYSSGTSGIYSANNIAALQMPIVDTNKYLRGTLAHIYYSGSVNSVLVTTPLIFGNSMYVIDSNRNNIGFGSSLFYLGELE